LKGRAEVIAVSHEKMRAELKEKTAKLGRVAFAWTYLPGTFELFLSDGMAESGFALSFSPDFWG